MSLQGFISYRDQIV